MRDILISAAFSGFLGLGFLCGYVYGRSRPAKRMRLRGFKSVFAYGKQYIRRMDVGGSIATFDPPLVLLRDEHVGFSIGTRPSRPERTILDATILHD